MNESITTNRLGYLDAAKGIGILMLIWGHIICKGTVFIWTDACKVPIFFVISGIFFVYKDNGNRYGFREFAKHRARRLMLAYFAFSAPALVVAAVLDALKGEPVLLGLASNMYDILTLHGLSTLWFLPALWLGEMAYYFIAKTKKPVQALLLALSATAAILGSAGIYRLADVLKDRAVISFLLGSPLITVGRVLVALPFITAGGLLSDIIISMPPKKALLTGGGLLLAYTAAFWLNKGIDLNNLMLGNAPVLLFVLGAMSSAGWILLAKGLPQYTPKALLWCGSNSLALMATHMPLEIVPALRIAAAALFGFPPANMWLLYAVSLVMLAVAMIPEYILVTLINRYLPFMLGKTGRSLT